MTLYFLYLLAELLILYLISRHLTQLLYIVFYLLTRSKRIAVTLVTVLLFPGTVVHELSHLFTAEVLRVRTGGISFEPDIPKDLGQKTGNFGIVTGHVLVAETDPVRRYFIGTAPMFTGLIVLAALSYFLPELWTAIRNTPIERLFSLKDIYLFSFLLYLLFSVSNSMFSSPADLKGVWGVIAVGVILIVAAYIAGFRVELTGTLFDIVSRSLSDITKSLGIVLVINVILSLLLMLMFALLRRLFLGRR